jgi:hypothetical protein
MAHSLLFMVLLDAAKLFTSLCGGGHCKFHDSEGLDSGTQS